MSKRKLFLYTGLILFCISFFLKAAIIDSPTPNDLTGYEAFLYSTFLNFDDGEGFNLEIFRLKILGYSNLLIVISFFLRNSSLKIRTGMLIITYAAILLQFSFVISSFTNEDFGIALKIGFYVWLASYCFISISHIDFTKVGLFMKKSNEA